MLYLWNGRGLKKGAKSAKREELRNRIPADTFRMMSLWIKSYPTGRGSLFSSVKETETIFWTDSLLPETPYPQIFFFGKSYKPAQLSLFFFKKKKEKKTVTDDNSLWPSDNQTISKADEREKRYAPPVPTTTTPGNASRCGAWVLIHIKFIHTVQQ
jgi:hypothetical protein